MNIFVIGGGGREHAIICALKKSPRVDKLYCAPGNAGIARLAECLPIGVMDFDAILTAAQKITPDMIVIGPDDPLAGGLSDILSQAGFRVFGPSKRAAIIESSKGFAKDLMKKYQIPTAAYALFTEAQAAYAYISSADYPLVLKADGLALGKGVLICENESAARAGIKALMEDGSFGAAGKSMVIEEYLTGHEVSMLAFVDAKTVKPMASAQDYKRVGDNDTGPNTGGMGAISPSPHYTASVDDFCRRHIYQKTVDAMRAEGREFKGIIFFGLMLTADGPKVLEYNARFGDPETQVVLTRMETDLVSVLEACMDGRLDEVELSFTDDAAVCVVLASDGYPGDYKTGYRITGLEQFAAPGADCHCFHAGTRHDGESNDIVTKGGRVLGVCASGENVVAARGKAYGAASKIGFENKYMRSDIGMT